MVKDKRKEKNKTKDINIELLRIFCMLIIIIHHLCLHGLRTGGGSELLFNRFIVNAGSLGGVIGNNIFVLISGYYMYKSKFTLKKFLKLELEVLSFSLLFLLFNKLIINPEIIYNFEMIKSSLFPTVYLSYGFFSAYIILMLFSKYLNKLIEVLKKNDHLKLIILSVFLFSILPSCFKINFYFSNFVWFMLLYFIAAYIRKYINIKNKIFVISSFIFIFIISIIVNNYFGYFNNEFAKQYGILSLILSINIFLIFLTFKKQFKHNFLNKVIALVSSATFGIYLIHDNIFIRPWLWNTLLNVSQYLNSRYLFIDIIVIALSIFIVCMVIELIRANTIERIYISIIDKIEYKLANSKKRKC